MLAGPGYGIPPKEATSTTAVIRRAVFERFHKENPDVRVVNAGGLSLVGPQADNMFLMSMAGDRAPDVFYVNFRQYYTFLEQGFARPLDDLIAQNPDAMARANPTVEKVLKSFDGKTYAVPFFQVAVALYYRKDMFREVGLDPSKPPRTWDEFHAAARKLTRKDRFGFSFSNPPGYHWQNFLYQAGGEVVEPGGPGGRWRSVIASKGGEKAIEFYRKLMLPGAKGELPVAQNSTDLTTDVNTGKTAMWFSYTNDVVMNQSDLSPSVVGVAALPVGPTGKPVNEVNAGMWAINSAIKDPKKLAACWRFIRFFAGDEAARINTEKCVELGIGNLVNPEFLKKFGYEDLLASVDPAYVKANEQLFQTGHPEPYGKNCQQVYEVINAALDDARLNPKKPAATILAETQKEMDSKLLGYLPPDVLARRRAWGWGILLLAGGVGVGLGGRAVVRLKDAVPVHESLPAGIPRWRIWRFLAICLAPAVLTIALWHYYPLARGLQIAFQDYRLSGARGWVGIDNFVDVFSQPVFWRSLLNSFVYVGLSLLIGFFLPIALALGISEIPRFQTFFRTVFYLPAMTSPVVVALVWRQLYDKTDEGILNSLLKPVIERFVSPVWQFLGGGPVPTANDWLGNPTLSMFAVVLPGIWAGAGAGSILYLAALKNISPERYEAADLDGATWWQKIRFITLPGLKPLILINLLGVFVAGFKAMENVFVLTQGGPLNSTRTIGLEIWQNAFMFLKFGYATAAAWVMGSILVGFTMIQIRSLLKMRFTAGR